MKGQTFSRDVFLKIRSGKQTYFRSTDKQSINEVLFLKEPFAVLGKEILYQYERDASFWKSNFPDAIFKENNDENKARYFIKITGSDRVPGTEEYQYTIELTAKPSRQGQPAKEEA